jgi:hypothetical protein
MQRIEAIESQIDDVNNVASVRLQIVELLLTCLHEHKDTLDDWKKTHFSNAIGALGLNIHTLHQPTTAWLRLCLADFKKANLPMDQRDPNFRSSDPSMRDVTYAQLLGAVDALGRELSQGE